MNKDGWILKCIKLQHAVNNNEQIIKAPSILKSKARGWMFFCEEQNDLPLISDCISAVALIIQAVRLIKDRIKLRWEVQ